MEQIGNIIFFSIEMNEIWTFAIYSGLTTPCNRLEIHAIFNKNT